MKLAISLNSMKQRGVILGCAVLVLSLAIVGLIQIGSTAPEVISKLRIYINPEAAKICAIARAGFSVSIAAIGVLGFLACILFGIRKRAIGTEPKDSSFELSEATHFSYALHAVVLIFICVIGIVSRRVAVDPSPGILIELTPSEMTDNAANTSGKKVGKVVAKNLSRKRHVGWNSKMATISSAARIQQRERITAKVLTSKTEKPKVAVVESEASQVVAPRVESAEQNVDNSATIGPSSDKKDSTAEAEEATVSVPAPETAATTLPFVTAMARPRSFIVPNFDLLLENNPISPSSSVYVPSRQASELDSVIDQTVESSNEVDSMGFDQSLYLTSSLPSGDAFGIISRHSIADENFEECLEELSEQKYSMIEPGMVRDICVDAGGLPMLARRRRGVAVSMVPPDPHRVSNANDYSAMSTPDVPSGSEPIRDENRTRCLYPSFEAYMTDLQRRIKRHWYPPKICTSVPKTVVHFSIDGDGTLKKLRMYKGSGIQIYDSAALKAVENAAPFKPLPADTPSTVDIEFTFDFNCLLERKSMVQVNPHSLGDRGRAKAADQKNANVSELAQFISERLKWVWSAPSNNDWVEYKFVIGSGGQVSNVVLCGTSNNILCERAASTAIINGRFWEPVLIGGQSRDLNFYFDRLNCESAIVECTFRGVDSAVRIEPKVLELISPRSK